jgi:hypothetical protein
MDKLIKYLSNKLARMEVDRVKTEPNIRNPNQFRRNFNPQFQQRPPRNNDQQIQAPLKDENMLEGDEDQENENIEEMNLDGEDEVNPHVTQEEYEQSLSFGQFFNEENVNNVDTPSPQYRLFSDAIQVELHNKYDLRPRPKNNKVVDSSQPKKILIKDKSKEATAAKQQSDQPTTKVTKIEPKEPEKSVSSFNLEHELCKIKIPVPLVELAKSPLYKKKISKIINFSDSEIHVDTINLHDEHPTIMFGPNIEDTSDSIAPFYISLTVHDHLLHNCMLDSGASHNLMPKIIMEKLGLQITRLYQDIYSFDSRKVKCIGMIKDLVVNLAQILQKVS